MAWPGAWRRRQRIEDRGLKIGEEKRAGETAEFEQKVTKETKKEEDKQEEPAVKSGTLDAMSKVNGNRRE